MKCVAFDVGGTFIKHALIDEKGYIYKQNKIPTPRTSQNDFLDCIQQVLDNYDDYDGIAMSLPGTIDSFSGFVYQGGSLKYNSMTNLKQLMEERFHCQVEIENDAHCAAQCEQWIGNLQGIDNAIVLTFGTGIGGCFIFNGKPYKGTHQFAGEVSILMTKDFNEYGWSSIWGPQGSVVKLVERISLAKHMDIVDGKTMFEWIENNDIIATQIFQEYCHNIARQLFNFQVSVDPQCICIGGGASANPLFIENIRNAMNKLYDALPIDIPRLEILPCLFYNDSNLIGAMHHYITRSIKSKQI